jgi:hypothetical protein
MPNIAAAKPTNSLTTRVIKYIPAEMITLYTTATGILLGVDNDAERMQYLKYITIFMLILTPLWRYFSVNDNPEPIGNSAKKAALFNAAISLLSIWLYISIDIINPTMKKELKIFINNPIMASLLLLFFSAAIVPLLERIILGKPIEQNLLNDKS